MDPELRTQKAEHLAKIDNPGSIRMSAAVWGVPVFDIYEFCDHPEEYEKHGFIAFQVYGSYLAKKPFALHLMKWGEVVYTYPGNTIETNLDDPFFPTARVRCGTEVVELSLV